MPHYEIFLHGQGLKMIDQEGVKREGGVYVWRAVSADDEASAVTSAERDLLDDPVFRDEIWNDSLDEIRLSVEEIRRKSFWQKARDTGPVFYIDTARDL